MGTRIQDRSMQGIAYLFITLTSLAYANLLDDKISTNPLAELFSRNQGKDSKLFPPNPCPQRLAGSQGQYSTIEITEGGTKFTQENILDSQNNLLINLVPAHNGFAAAKYVFDGDSDLMMTVMEKEKSCTVQKNLLAGETVTDTFTSYTIYRNAASRSADGDIPIKLVKKPFETYVGYGLRHMELPKKFQPHCPPDYMGYTAHTVDVENASPWNPHMLSDNLKSMADFYDYKPQTYIKGQGRGTCVYVHPDNVTQTIFSQCFNREFDCNAEVKGKQACPNAGYNFNCRSVTSGGCYYKLVPQCMKKDGTLEHGCLLHIMSGPSKCTPCCETLKCGAALPKCVDK